MNFDDVVRSVKNLLIGGETAFSVDEPLTDSEHTALAVRLSFSTGYDLSLSLDASRKNITIHRNY